MDNKIHAFISRQLQAKNRCSLGHLGELCGRSSPYFRRIAGARERRASLGERGAYAGQVGAGGAKSAGLAEARPDASSTYVKQSLAAFERSDEAETSGMRFLKTLQMLGAECQAADSGLIMGKDQIAALAWCGQAVVLFKPGHKGRGRP
ncbi:MAG: hypothetical protein ABSG50_06040 [Opitutaceae bacterium]